MVVQCEHCQTKYRIADEKVKGKGVKVRCAKCENVFTVTPPENNIQAPPSPPPEPPTPEPPAPEPPTSESGIDAGHPGTDDPGPPASDQPVMDEPASDPVESPAGLPPLPPLDSFHDPPAPGDEQLPPGLPPLDQPPGDLIPPSLDGPAADTSSQRPAHELDQAGLVSPPPEPVELPDDSGLDDGRFEIEATLRDDPAPESSPFGDEPGTGLPPLTQAATQEGEWGNISIHGQGSSKEDSDDFGLAGESGYTPPPPMPMEEPTEPPPPEHWEGDPDGTSPVPAYQPETKGSGGGKKAVILLILLAALGGGGYFAYPTVMEMVQSRTQQAEGTLTPANIQVKSLSRADGKIIYSVRGEVRNESEGNVGMIQVEAQFRNASGDVLRKATSFCGNLVPDSDLARLNLDKVRSDLQNELGQSLSNANIPPGQSVPFLVVLDNPPSGISKVTVTISSFKETT